MNAVTVDGVTLSPFHQTIIGCNPDVRKTILEELVSTDGKDCRNILILRAGLDVGGHPRSITTVAKMLGMTPSRVSQYETQTMRALANKSNPFHEMFV